MPRGLRRGHRMRRRQYRLFNRTSDKRDILPGDEERAKREKAVQNNADDRELILALQDFFIGMGKSNVQGFHYLDSNSTKRIDAKEIMDALDRAGYKISLDRSENLIRRHSVFDSTYIPSLDVPQFIRFMASGYRLEDKLK
jgi:Ca2+-binding EF-hand superfamily protein